MEGSEIALSPQSEEGSLLDLSCTVTEKNFLVNPSIERNNDLSSSVNEFVSPASTTSDTDPDSAIFEERIAGADRNLWPESCEETKSSNCMHSEAFQANGYPLAWTLEQKEEGESTIKKSLDTFYSTCCSKKRFGGSPALESALQYLSAKIADASHREGTEYAVRSLQVAQMVLNRDGHKMVFPQHSSGTCFSAAAAAASNVNFEGGKKIPGLSDDILQRLVKHDVTK